MLLKQYKIQVIDPSLRAYVEQRNGKSSYIIIGNDLPGAWRKFCRQHCGVNGNGDLCPNPSDYDISFHSTRSA